MGQRDLRALGLGTVLVVGLWTARAYYSASGMYGFLLWNTVLALAPWGLAIALSRAAEADRPATSGALGLLWLLFLPNAPYLVTDLLHLRARPPVPLWYDVLLLGAAALVGLLAGAFSLARVQRVVTRARGTRVADLVILAAILASGFGIYLGRFERFNSWDLLLHPATVLLGCAQALRPRAMVVTAACAALLAVTYVGVVEPTHSSSPKRSR